MSERADFINAQGDYVFEAGGPGGGAYMGTTRRCSDCGQAGLVWLEREKKWRLCTPKGQVHVCEEYEESSRMN